jgi:hypothetical protein
MHESNNPKIIQNDPILMDKTGSIAAYTSEIIQ